MPQVIPVRMHFNANDLWFDPAGTGAAAGDYVVVDTERGTEFGLATMDPFEAPEEEIEGQLKPVLRVASQNDVVRAEELANQGDEAMPIFRDMVSKYNLDIKPAGVEFLFGGEKTVFYFAAEERIDFRELVRELASHFHARVDMRQIGVRDEARLRGGYSTCGQELCCRRMGLGYEPVSIRMAKEQDLPLNSSKVSGMCGRLMCCLRYEFEAYKDFKQRAPKRNTVISTPLGKAKIIEYNMPRETLTMRLENGKSFTVELSQMSCSSGCCCKAKENGTRPRPDTVGREALERIGTTEILAQLAELDRLEDPDKYAYELNSSLLEQPRQGRSGRDSSSKTRGQRSQDSSGQHKEKRRQSRQDNAQQVSVQQDSVQQDSVQPDSRQQDAGTPDGRPRNRRGMQPRRHPKHDGAAETTQARPGQSRRSSKTDASSAVHEAQPAQAKTQTRTHSGRNNQTDHNSADGSPTRNNRRRRTVSADAAAASGHTAQLDGSQPTVQRRRRRPGDKGAGGSADSSR